MQQVTKKTTIIKIGHNLIGKTLREIKKYNEVSLVSRGRTNNGTADDIIAILQRENWEVMKITYSDFKFKSKPKEVKIDIKIEQKPTPALLVEKEAIITAKEVILRKKL